MRKYYFLYFLLMAFAGKGFAQIEEKIFEETSLDSSVESFDRPYHNNTIFMHPVQLLEDSLASRKLQKIYAYHNNLDSLLKDWKSRSSEKTVKPSTVRLPAFSLFGNGIFRFLIWAAAIFFVLFILYKLFLNKGLFSRDTGNSTSLEQLTEEEIFYKSDYNSLIKQALELGDYRVALRYYFLKTLYQLNDKKMLEFAADKTNLKYYYELPANMKEGFLQISRYYEYSWYGQVKLSKEQFDSVEKNFKQYEEKIIS